MTIDERQEDLIAQFELVDDWMDRYQMIIDLGDQLEPVDATERTSENLIDGCQSRVWIVISTQSDGTLHLKADSDALITKGIAAMLLYCYNDQPAKAIVDTPLYFIERLGLQSHLSPTRSNGLQSMYETIRRRAAECLDRKA
jgi:SufE protein probably involved in Fe-S center assembly